MATGMNKPILCLDFDGVIHSYTSGWKGPRTIPDDPVPGAIEFLVEALQHFRVAIYSSRSHYWFGRRAMKKWLEYHATDWFFDCTSKEQSEAFYALPIPFSGWTDLVIGLPDDADRGILFGAALPQLIEWPTHKPPALVTLDDRAITFMGKWPDVGQLKKFKPWNKS